MHLPRIDTWAVRSALGLVVLAAAAALAVHVGLDVGDPPNSSQVSAAEARDLSNPRPPVIHQTASAACLRAASAVSEVRSTGDQVRIRFAGQPGVMTIQYLTSTRAAIRYANAHPDPLPNNVWANTNWFHTPLHLTHAVLSVLGRCLPMDHATPTRGFAAAQRSGRA